METTYTTTQPFQGREFKSVLDALSPSDIRKTLKNAYRRIGRKVIRVVASKAATTVGSNGRTLRHGEAVGRSARTFAYSRGGGFAVTVKPRGRSGAQYNTSRGVKKPVAIWANAGTEPRHRRAGKAGKVSTGRMPAYDFLTKANEEAVRIVNADTLPIVEDAAKKKLKRNGISL